MVRTWSAGRLVDLGIKFEVRGPLRRSLLDFAASCLPSTMESCGFEASSAGWALQGSPPPLRPARPEGDVLGLAQDFAEAPRTRIKSLTPLGVPSEIRLFKWSGDRI